MFPFLITTSTPTFSLPQQLYIQVAIKVAFTYLESAVPFFPDFVQSHSLMSNYLRTSNIFMLISVHNFEILFFYPFTSLPIIYSNILYTYIFLTFFFQLNIADKVKSIDHLIKVEDFPLLD